MSVMPMPEKRTTGGLPERERGTANRFGGNDQPPQAPAVKPKDVAPSKPKAAPARPKADKTSGPAGTVLSAPDYIDNLAQSISIDNGDYIVHWTKGGRKYTMAVPETWIRRGPRRGSVMNSDRIYNDRQEAVAALTPRIINDAGKYTPSDYVGFWRDEEVPVTAPTLFSEMTTPNILAGIEAKDEDMRQAAREAEGETISLAKGMLIGRWLGGAYAEAQASFRGPVIAPRTANANPMNARGVPPRGASSSKVPPAAGSTSATSAPQTRATSATSAPQTRATSGTGPPASGSAAKTPTPQASPAQRSTTLASRATSAPLSGPLPGIPGSKGAAISEAGQSTMTGESLSAELKAARDFYPGHRGQVGSLSAPGTKPMFIKSGVDGGPWGGTQRGGIPRGRTYGYTSGGPSQGNIATHVEGHAAAIMYQQNIMEATLVMGAEQCFICSRDLPDALPPGSKLTVINVDPAGNVTSSNTYRSSHAF